MKTKDLLIIASTALGTATLTVAFLASPRMSGDDANLMAATIAKPKLSANGIEMTLCAANGRQFKAGDQPEFELRAVNTLSQPCDVTVRVSLSAETMDSMFSRIVPMPSVLWHEELAIALKPNETKAFTLATRTNLPAKSHITVILTTVGQPEPGKAAGIVAMQFSTEPPAAAPAYAATTAGQAAVIPALR
jgi:hypothetical protein